MFPSGPGAAELTKFLAKADFSLGEHFLFPADLSFRKARTISVRCLLSGRVAVCLFYGFKTSGKESKSIFKKEITVDGKQAGEKLLGHSGVFRQFSLPSLRTSELHTRRTTACTSKSPPNLEDHFTLGFHQLKMQYTVEEVN